MFAPSVVRSSSSSLSFVPPTRRRLPLLSLLLLLTTTSSNPNTLATAFSLSMMSSKIPKNIVIVGGGIQGTSVAYHLAKRTKQMQDGDQQQPATTITILEAEAVASAASGKGGGFMGRSWGSYPTTQLHELAFDLYEKMAIELGCSSYRKLPVLSVSPGKQQNVAATIRDQSIRAAVPNWLDGRNGRINSLGDGTDTAQITPTEFVDAMLRDASDSIDVVIGTCVGVETTTTSEADASNGQQSVVGVKYRSTANDDEVELLDADVVVVSAGPWSCAAEDWFAANSGGLKLPMEGVKSTSIVWKKPDDAVVDGTALFCGEDNRYSTHLEVYPRPDGSIYICGIGGSDYISTDDLKHGAFRGASCQPNERRVEAAVTAFTGMSQLYKDRGELDKTQACMRPCPPDALPYMGAIPGYSGAYINAGHNCWGIAWAPACGQAMAELILDGDSESIDLSPFDPSRFTPAAKRGTRGRKKQGTNVGEQW